MSTHTSRPSIRIRSSLTLTLTLYITSIAPLLLLLQPRTITRLPQHPIDNLLTLNNIPQPISQRATPLAELALAQAENYPAQNLPRDTPLGGVGGAGEDGEFGDRVACRLGLGAVVVEAEGCGEGEGGFGGEDGAF